MTHNRAENSLAIRRSGAIRGNMQAGIGGFMKTVGTVTPLPITFRKERAM
jgi:hypothetical protein